MIEVSWAKVSIRYPCLDNASTSTTQRQQRPCALPDCTDSVQRWVTSGRTAAEGTR